MSDVVDQALGQALRKLRTERGWSQSDLALRVQMDRNYLSLIELGRSSPSVRMLLRLCAALDVRAADVLDDVERRVLAQQSGLAG
ncbi:helix-turn-helix domain-containing protein [Comamonas nitrativorans]|uniref:Helix-turn-helix domain-containing protein n=1 Tax=Comamonas nitrativorans TaxID=108437 RepID=A0ABV9GV19_9BURK